MNWGQPARSHFTLQGREGTKCCRPGCRKMHAAPSMRSTWPSQQRGLEAAVQRLAGGPGCSRLPSASACSKGAGMPPSGRACCAPLHVQASAGAAAAAVPQAAPAVYLQARREEASQQ